MSSEDPSKQTVLWKIADTIFGNNAIVDEQRYIRLQACSQLERAYQHCELRRRRPINTATAATTTDAVSMNLEEKDMERLQDSRNGLKISRFYNWNVSHNRAQATISAMRGASTNSTIQSKEEEIPLSPPTQTRQGIVHGLLGVGIENMKDQVTRTSVSKDEEQTLHMGGDSTCHREMHAVWACRALSLGCGSDLVQLKQCFESQDKEEESDPKCFYLSPPQSSSQGSTTQDCNIYQRQVAKCVVENWKNLQQRRSHS